MSPVTRIFRLLCSAAVGIPLFVLADADAAPPATVITFNEPVAWTGAGAGFNGRNNQFLHSADGAYRLESFTCNSAGHFHITTFDSRFGGAYERNHNHSWGARSLTQLQGIRITRLDGEPFDFVSLDLFGQAAVGWLDNEATGAGKWTLFDHASPRRVEFGDAFACATEVYLVDPFAAGATRGANYWDNIVLRPSPPPEPPPIEVEIDIQPADDSNQINLRAQGLLPVAVLSCDCFDALEVDEETVLFGDPESIAVCDGRPVAPRRSAVIDVDGDGRDDLVLYFSIPELDAAGALDAASVAAFLTAETFAGLPLVGRDMVRIVPAQKSGAKGPNASNAKSAR